ncbi:SWF or SNF family helicase [Streptomyces sp. NPDC008313]|uniref:SWIM zinc finger family protein n=1 Tax=Streptomyces sp. NPDC008313 TaxID=3364826 RepID=UPI0036EB6E63
MNDRHEDRTFPALPPARGRGFAETWWGRAWLKALEDTALDSAQLKAGRALARAGAVGAVSVRPGRVTAVVRDRDGTPRRADVLLQELSGSQWEHFLDMAVERSGHVAALLDREMPPHLVEDAAAAGVELLPGLGDLEARCDCDAWDHCAHSTALCYQMARLVDQDPFVLLLMRGRGEHALLRELRVRDTPRAGTAAPDEVHPAGVDAADAYAAGGILPRLPDPPELPGEPGPPPALDTEAEAAPGVEPAALEHLAAQAAEAAHRLLADALGPGHAGRPPAPPLTLAQDAVRLAAGQPERTVSARLAQGSGRDAESMALAVRAWREGGADALSVLEDEWAGDATSLARARAALEAAWEEGDRPAFQRSGNRWTLEDESVQLRLGRDGRWWPYRDERGRWAPAGPAAGDPATALATAEGDVNGEPAGA